MTQKTERKSLEKLTKRLGGMGFCKTASFDRNTYQVMDKIRDYISLLTYRRTPLYEFVVLEMPKKDERGSEWTFYVKSTSPNDFPIDGLFR